MRRILIAVTLLVLSSFTFADIESDLANGVDMDTIIENALAEDPSLTLADIVSTVVGIDSSKAGDVVDAAIRQDSTVATAVVEAAVRENSSTATAVTEAAVAAGADGTTIVNTVTNVVPNADQNALQVAVLNGQTRAEETAAGNPDNAPPALENEIIVDNGDNDEGPTLDLDSVAFNPADTAGGGTVEVVLIEENTNLGGLENAGSGS